MNDPKKIIAFAILAALTGAYVILMAAALSN